MANTLNFGNGKWGVQDGLALAYNDENNNFKPLPFDFTRDSIGTYVDRDGLIKTASNNVPRVDFLGNTKGALLLETQSTNLIPYSEDFSNANWNKTRCTITTDQLISPNGTLNADLLTVTNTSENYVQNNTSISVGGNKQTVSCFVKKGTSDYAHILLWNTTSDGVRQWFDLTNGTLGGSTTFGTGISVYSAEMVNYGNNWYRCTVVYNNSNTSVRSRISASNANLSTDSTVGKTIYIYGFQLEQGSYATSYIPTSGSTVARVAETCSGAGNSEVFNDSEGVLYIEASTFLNGANNRITLSGGSDSNRVSIEFDANANTIKGFMGLNGYIETTNYDQTNNLKIALNYKVNDFKMFINGVKIGTDTTATPSTGIDRVDFSNFNGDVPFLGICRDLRVYNTALTDAELATLTTT